MAGPQAQARPSVAGLRYLAAIAVSLTPAPACASAWIAAESQEIWTNVAGSRDDLRFYESAAYWEEPIGDAAAIVVSPWVEQNQTSAEGWRAEALFGLKHKLVEQERTVVAVQASGVWASEPAGGCDEGGGELRVLGGRSFGETGFVNVEAATRALSGGCRGERLDLTLGYRPFTNWLGMAQIFADRPLDGDDAVRGQLSLVRFGESGRGVQIGVRARLDGEAETAVVLGFWGAPRD
ncbi:MAG: hypothetical protein K2P58_09630 [Hyphomonadaceae bacterium]|nr:hypothetical protein [Hyphomonadaceae bacterium]